MGTGVSVLGAIHGSGTSKDPFYLDGEKDVDPMAPIISFNVSGGGPLQDIPSRTIRKVQGKRSNTTYINKVGPQSREWYVLADCRNEPEGDELGEKGGFIDIGNKYYRRISKSYVDPSEAPKASNALTIINVAFEYDTGLIFPLEAAELLNPKTVKRTPEFKNFRERQAYSKADRRLPSFPTTYVLVKWADVKYLTWETASEYKAFKGNKMLFQIEKMIYDVALYRAGRIEELLKVNRERMNNEAKRTAELMPSIEFTPVPEQASSSTPAATRQTSATPTPAVGSTPAVTRQTSATPAPALDTTPSAPQVGVPSGTPAESATSNSVPQKNPSSQLGVGNLPTPRATPEPGQKTPSPEGEKFKAWLREYCRNAKIEPKTVDRGKATAAYAAAQLQEQDDSLWDI
jgi:hypothetical protein